MKKSVRQVLSLVMALCLLLSLVPAVFAAETPVETADALTAALETGGTVTLGADITVGERLTVSKDTVLDLNGYTLTVDTSGRIAVMVSAALTVRDSSDGERGKLTSGAYMTAFLDVPDSEEDARRFPSNSLTLLSGTLENTQKGGCVIVAQGRDFSTVTVKGGTVLSKEGQAVSAQARAAISGGAFRGEVYLPLPELTCHEITGGCFDLPFDGSLTGNKYSFYGTRYKAEASGDPEYPWHVTQAFDGGFTVSYQFPAGSGLSRRDDVFESGARIEEEPNAPDYADHSLRFEAWYTVDPDTGEDRMGLCSAVRARGRAFFPGRAR